MSSADEPVAMEDIWGTFFRQSEEVLIALLFKKKVSLDDVDDIEPYLMLGLPAATFLEAVLRSRDQGGLVMATGLTVTEKTVPSEVSALFKALTKCKAGCIGLTSEDEMYLRFAVLFQMKECEATGASTGGGSPFACAAGGDDEAFQLAGALSPPIAVSGEPTYPSEERKILLRRTVISPLGSVVTEVSQLPFFKSNFLAVLESASTKYRGRLAARGEHEPAYGTEVGQ